MFKYLFSVIIFSGLIYGSPIFSQKQTKIEKPVRELKGFAKTKLLQPNESQQLTFVLDGKLLASYWSGISAWVADKGQYEVLIGASSKDIRQKASFEIPETIIVEKTHPVLYQNRLLKELSVEEKK